MTHRHGITWQTIILTYFFHNIFLHNHFQANRYIHNPQPGHGKGLHFGILHPHNHQDLQQHIIIKYMKSASTLRFKQIRFELLCHYNIIYISSLCMARDDDLITMFTLRYTTTYQEYHIIIKYMFTSNLYFYQIRF